MSQPSASPSAEDRLRREDAGYHKGLRPRQLQMIAIGGAIGTGLFLGAGGRLASAGPSLFLIYGICGVFVFLILRALGELVLHRPSSGSFVSYAREFFGEKVAFVAGWMYFVNWAMTGIVDITAIATYFHYWRLFHVVPQWLLALLALVAVVGMNLISVKLFGELEFWAALIKVIALLTFLVVGTVFLAGRYEVDGHETGLSLWHANGDCSPPDCCRWCWSPPGWCSPTRRWSWWAPRPGDRRTGEGHAPGDQLGDRPNRDLLRRIGVTAGASAALHRLPSAREPVRHVLRQSGFRRCRRPDEPGGSHRRTVEPERRAVLHRPDPAFDGGQRQRAPFHCGDVEKRCALRGSCSPPGSACSGWG